MSTGSGLRLIKRYANRKMYDTQASRYVTLDNIAEMVRSSDEVRIIDNDSGEDLTAVTFAQIIFEEAKRDSGVMGLPILRSIIRQGGAAIQEIISGVDRGREAIESVRDLAEKRVKAMAETAGVQARDTRKQIDRAEQSGRRLLNEIFEMPQRQIEQLQHRIDTQVRASLERVTEHPAVKHELQRIESSIKSLEHQLGRLRAPGKKSKPASKGRKPKAPLPS